MKASQRVLVNTVAQYTRTIINMLLSLYTVRVVLSALGQSDYGIYTLIAGVVAMLGFITNSLVATTQRFVSYYQGKGEKEQLKTVFNNSVLIHLFLGLAVVIILEAVTPLLFHGFLNIPEGRVQAATIIYQLVIVILFITFITSPYRALLVSHENIVYISIVDVLDGLLKVLLVIIMSVSNADKLIFYGFVMLGVQLFNFFALSIYSHIKYEECVRPNIKRWDSSYVKELMSFAGWRIYGTACTVGRDQGISIVLNRAYGTIMNAGWGIGMQIAGYTNYLSSAIVNAMAPQIVKAEGGGNRQHSIWLSNVLSKLVFFLMSLVGIPLIFEINNILTLWLGAPPDNAALFSIFFIIALLVDSMTIGLTHINNAIGNIRKYILCLNTPKFFTFLFVYLMVKVGAPVYCVGVAYVLIEGICAFVRIPLIKEQAGLDVPEFIKDVLLREALPLLFCVASCIICTSLFSFTGRFVITFLLSAIVYASSMYFWGLTEKERTVVKGLALEAINKLKKN